MAPCEPAGVSVLDLVLPPACGACGGFGHVLCPRCRGSFRPATDPATRFLAADPGVVIGTQFRAARAAFVYEGAVRRALQKLKYGGVARLAVPLADAALPTLAEVLRESGPAMLVPVPVHPARQRERGYNQAALLADRLARRTGLPQRELLARTRPTVKQHTLDRAARLRNLASAFALRSSLAVAPEVVVIVDDIMTTSATLETCASVLRGAGVREVYGLAVAREV